MQPKMDNIGIFSMDKIMKYKQMCCEMPACILDADKRCHIISSQYTHVLVEERQKHQTRKKLFTDEFTSRIFASLNKLTDANIEAIKNELLILISNLEDKSDLHPFAIILFKKISTDKQFILAYSKLCLMMSKCVPSIIPAVIDTYREIFDEYIKSKHQDVSQQSASMDMKAKMLNYVTFACHIYNCNLISHMHVSQNMRDIIDNLDTVPFGIDIITTMFKFVSGKLLRDNNLFVHRMIEELSAIKNKCSSFREKCLIENAIKI